MPPLPTLQPLKDALCQCQTVQALETLCAEHGCTPYYVGGLVRDFLLTGQLSDDIDVVLPRDAAEDIAEALALKIDGASITLDARYGIYRVFDFEHDLHVDIAARVGPDIHTDLLRRDATVNAMAISLADDEGLIDPTGGVADLTARRLRMVTPQNMLDDPLRFLRVFRLAAQLEFDIDPAFLSYTQTHGHRVLRVAVERIHMEIARLFSAPQCATSIRQMADTGMLEALFPELSAMHPIPGNTFHHLTLWQHTLELLTQAQIHFPDLPPPVQAILETRLTAHLTRLGVARLACLLHDVGKPATMTYDPADGRYRFYGHDAVSAVITQGIGARMKWGHTLTHQVSELVRWHLYPGDVVKPDTSLKAYRKFFRRIGDLLPEMMLLALADRFSAQGPAVTPADLAAFKTGLLGLWEKKAQLMASGEVSTHKLLTGAQVMRILNLPTGPAVGQALKAIETAYLNDEISTPQEAEAFLLNKYQKR